MKRLTTIALACAALTTSIPAIAAPAWVPYTQAGFAKAQAAGKAIVVDVHANWCPTCKAQAPILDELRSEKRLSGVTFVRVNFDTDKAFLREHRVPRQSTVLVFRGARETARSIAETRRTELRAAVLAGL